MAPPPPPSRRSARDAVEGAGGVVFDLRGRVLLLRHREGTWVFPKGHLDPGEDHLAAAVREVEEEAGVRAFRPDPSFRHVTRYVNARGEERAITWFLLEGEGGPVLREALFPDGAWLEPSEARARLAFGEDRRLLDAALAHRAGGPRGPGGRT